jgi:hypothetical protein
MRYAILYNQDRLHGQGNKPAKSLTQVFIERVRVALSGHEPTASRRHRVGFYPIAKDRSSVETGVDDVVEAAYEIWKIGLSGNYLPHKVGPAWSTPDMLCAVRREWLRAQNRSWTRREG